MLARDKLLHLGLGVLAVACALAALKVHAWAGGLGACLAFASTAVGLGYEWQQDYRGEGQPDPWDAAATAAPGWLAWALLSILPAGALP